MPYVLTIVRRGPNNSLVLVTEVLKNKKAAKKRLEELKAQGELICGEMPEKAQKAIYKGLAGLIPAVNKAREKADKKSLRKFRKSHSAIAKSLQAAYREELETEEDLARKIQASREAGLRDAEAAKKADGPSSKRAPRRRVVTEAGLKKIAAAQCKRRATIRANEIEAQTKSELEKLQRKRTEAARKKTKK